MSNQLLHYFNEIERFHWWWAGRRQLIRQLTAGQFSPRRHPSILDIGCGTGETLTFLQTLFPSAKLLGLDTSAIAVKYTQARGHATSLGNALKLPFPKSSFDIVLLLDVIEHIKDDTQVLVEAKRVLKPGGQIIVTAPALPFIWSDHDTHQGHKRRYTRRRMRFLSQQTGLKLTFLSYFNFFISPAIITIRLLGNLKHFKGLVSFDSNLNYSIAYKRLPNTLLTQLFIHEIKALKFLRYPWGISICACFTK
ncbi:hypothetical protein A2368_01210 [Candidatus Collierbacteria bacterium RIFOXYB1_FULL_49_13]|uniref:Methyltransferase type 11 domain-containing protein n=1 Tax=Candidatus Collierbacteria bacterium RIFOXYB1_FULL_49_13 TaxID=1817728 RepID=A0A1F5FFQ4_9BACT|nr:MAG: hypothetical protein A2368_01210 [Candidatus Collierbacteria bacterium RIFOXYB1_FULL_49_13]